jgi:CRP/FNR family transcriptional regulator, cyclic AMP receptor protein
METTFAAAAFQTQREDILALVPVSAVVEYRKGQLIYGPGQPSTSIYLVAAGAVRLSHLADDGYEVILEIIRADEVFGESAFLNAARTSDSAAAQENARLMVWPVSAIEDLMTKNPRLAVSLLQVLAQRTTDFAHRIESLAMDNIERRLARSLIRFSERLGTPSVDGSIRMMPLSHELLSRHIGTSREVVTSHMNQFRRQGYLDYSRGGIVLHTAALAAWINRTPPIPN